MKVLDYQGVHLAVLLSRLFFSSGLLPHLPHMHFLAWWEKNKDQPLLVAGSPSW